MSQQQLGYATPLRRPNRLALLLRSKRFRRALRYVTPVAVLYVGSYVVLSAMGQYEPCTLNMWGVSWYKWAPAGFVHNFRSRDALFYAYLPLYVTDRELWHPDGDAWRGRRHEPKDLAEIERAWKR